MCRRQSHPSAVACFMPCCHKNQSHLFLLQVTAMVAAGPRPPKLAPAVPLDDERPQSSQQPVNISLGDGPGADDVQRFWMSGQAWCCHTAGLLYLDRSERFLTDGSCVHACCIRCSAWRLHSAM